MPTQNSNLFKLITYPDKIRQQIHLLIFYVNNGIQNIIRRIMTT